MLLNEKQEKYKLLSVRLMQRCQEIQSENERTVSRINTIKKAARKRLRDVELLKMQLARYNDNWRSLPMIAPHPKRKTEQKRGRKPKKKDNDDTGPKEKQPRKKNDKKILIIKVSDNNLAKNNLLEETRYQESQAQQLAMMQQRQLNLKNQLL